MKEKKENKKKRREKRKKEEKKEKKKKKREKKTGSRSTPRLTANIRVSYTVKVGRKGILLGDIGRITLERRVSEKGGREGGGGS